MQTTFAFVSATFSLSVSQPLSLFLPKFSSWLSFVGLRRAIFIFINKSLQSEIGLKKLVYKTWQKKTVSTTQDQTTTTMRKIIRNHCQGR